jgi:uncharacterized membrane protein YkvA (DUF1232 family)
MNFKDKINEIKKYIATLFVALRKKETPWYAKFMAGITVGYALSPIDLIPDFIPIIGYLDDLIILPLLILLSIRMIPKTILEQSRIEADEIWKDRKPNVWYFAIPIVIIWIIILTIIVGKIIS